LLPPVGGRESPPSPPALHPLLLLYSTFFPTLRPCVLYAEYECAASRAPSGGPLQAPAGRNGARPHPKSPCVVILRASPHARDLSVRHSPPGGHPVSCAGQFPLQLSNTPPRFPCDSFIITVLLPQPPSPQIPLRIPRPTWRSVGTFSLSVLEVTSAPGNPKPP